MERIFAIGDIHGCIEEFKDLLQLIKPKSSDRIILLGDLVNRGPDSIAVLRLASSLDNCVCLVGNHELRLLKYAKYRDDTMLKQYDWDTVRNMEKRDWNFLRTFHKMIHIPEYDTIFVHGGFAPGISWEEQDLETITRIQAVNPETKEWGKRSEFENGVPWADYWEGPSFVVYGHTPRNNVFRRPLSLCIDTGCIYGSQLTAYEITEKKLYQVLARHNYMSRALSE